MGKSATWARSATQNDDQEGQGEALVSSSSQMDPALPRRMQSPTSLRWTSLDGTQQGAKKQLLTSRASMVEYQLDIYKFDVHHNHGWNYKKFNHYEPTLLATHDPLAYPQDPKSRRSQANQGTATIPPKPNQDHHHSHGHRHIGPYRTPMPRGEVK